MRVLTRLRRVVLVGIFGGVLGLPACGSPGDGDTGPTGGACMPFAGSAGECSGPDRPLLCTSRPNGVCAGNRTCEDWSTTGATPCKTAADCPKVDLVYQQPKALDPNLPNHGRTVHCDVGYCAEYACLQDSDCEFGVCPVGGICTDGEPNGLGGRGTCITPI
jgi:hypothetical protein